MGGAFGVAIGAKLGCPEKQVYLFTGDGCFRLFAGYLGEASRLGIVVFVINNGEYAIVDQGLNKIIPDISRDRYHATLLPIDFCSIASASGWDAFALSPDLANLDLILYEIAQPLQRSVLINVPVDPQQELGMNPRIKNL